MEDEESSSGVPEGEIVGITFALSTKNEICTASVSEGPINHVSQLSNPFLGLPLEFGKCESCGATEPDKCEGHFGYIDLPVPIYHPNHITELKQLLSLLCLKCLKIKKSKSTSNGPGKRLLGACCEEALHISIKEAKSDGACYLELKLPSRSRLEHGCWNFLERYGYRYGNDYTRPLLAREAKEILRRIPEETAKKLKEKGHKPQEGYILECLPVPPNCLSIPEASDGFSSMSTDPSRTGLRDVLKKATAIKSSRSAETNFVSHEAEANDVYRAVDNYFRVRGTASRNIDIRYGVAKQKDSCSSKTWSDKMKTLFIRKGSGFSSRSVITGDAYRGTNEIGVPYDIARRVTFEERVTLHNLGHLQDLVDKKLCLSYSEGSTTYSLRDGSKGHTRLKPGQIIHRMTMDGDTVFINRPPTTHKHSLQALQVYVHDDNTVKINPLICAPLGADFDGDCIHIFYPQSLGAKAEAMELFSVEKQLLSSHTGQLNLQLGSDAMLCLRMMLERVFLDKAVAQQLAMYGSVSLPPPALRKFGESGPAWTVFQLLQLAFPNHLSCKGDKFMVDKSEILDFDPGSDGIASIINNIITSIISEKGSNKALGFFDSLQPMLMEHLSCEGFSLSLEDFSMSRENMGIIQSMIKKVSPELSRLRLTSEDELQLEKSMQRVKEVAANFMMKSHSMRNLIDIKSGSSINKLVQQVGFLGLQLSDKKKIYSKTLVEDMAQFYKRQYRGNSSSGEFGLVKSCFFHGLDPYEEMAHAIATREVIVRSSRGLAEPGTLFKNLMANLRDVVIAYDGTVRNTSTNSIVQFKYEIEENSEHENRGLFEPGEAVGVLAATAMSNPAYKAVLDSSASSNSSWELMKEVLLCKANFQNAANDRRIILFLNECHCGKKYCQENAACTVKNVLKKITLKETAVEFLVEHKKQQLPMENYVNDSFLQGHVHLNKVLLQELGISMHEIQQKCEGMISSLGQKKKNADDFKRTTFSVSESCSFGDSWGSKRSDMACLMFSYYNAADPDLQRALDVLRNTIYPVLMETVIKGDPRILSVNIIWKRAEKKIQNCGASKGEWVLDVTAEKSAAKKSGDAWRVVIDSCLPVLHLVDTRRSIPYSVKQVQELLGICSTFEQVVQRLSASLRTVSKGVLKEHIVLLANHMTCSGNLLGFNAGGYKALTKSLNIIAPFTEATVVTPMKCFEKAAERCHTDSLSTVVGSCSWGKHVAVGTGSGFDLLWNTNEAKLTDKEGLDPYSFLQMTGSCTDGDAYADPLGFDVVDAEMEEWDKSPERDTALTFEDLIDEGKLAASKWEQGSLGDNGLSSGSTGNGEWNQIAAEVDKHDKKTSWDSVKESSQSAWEKPNVENSKFNESSWGAAKESNQSAWEKPNEETSKLNESTWGAAKESSQCAWEKPNEESGKCNESPWGSAKESSQCAWEKPNEENKKCNDSSWGSVKESGQRAWEKPKDESSKFDESSWGSVKESGQRAWEKPNEENKKCKESSWDSAKDSSQCAWEKPNEENKKCKESPWGSAKEAGQCAWEKPKDESSKFDKPSWGSASKGEESQNVTEPWGSKTHENDGNPWVSLADTRSRDGNEKERSQWGNPKKRFPSEGSQGDWEAKRTPLRVPRTVKEDMFTATRQRLDMFTSEEQDILSEVEPIMKTVRKIMHQTGYKDGDPISLEDQMFVQEKILKFHPEKDAKLGAGVDYITVDKHTSFPESRCFFVVSTDGSRQDFSYIKCVKNFITEKYTGMAEEFIGKYFKKKTLPSGGNQDKNKDAKTAETFERSPTEIPESPFGIGAEETQTGK